MGKSEVMDDAIASFAMAYAAQTAIDHAALVRAKTNQDGKTPSSALEGPDSRSDSRARASLFSVVKTPITYL
jgi:hypothetical protein